eukprot:g415.t1
MNLAGAFFVFLCLNGATLAQFGNWPHRSAVPSTSPPVDSPTKSPAKSVYPQQSPPMNSLTKNPAMSDYPFFSPPMESPTKSPAKSVYPQQSPSMMQSVSPSPSRVIRFAIIYFRQDKGSFKLG